MKLELQNYSRYHIDTKLVGKYGLKWCLPGIYGEPVNAKRKITRKLLHILNQHFNLPWLCTGDFDEIMYNHEKKMKKQVVLIGQSCGRFPSPARFFNFDGARLQRVYPCA